MAQQAEDLAAWMDQNGENVYSDEAFVATSTPRRRHNGPRRPTDLPVVAEQSRSLYLDFLQRQIQEEGQRQDLGQAGYSYDPPDADLSHLLHSFAQSDERRIIRQHAQEVPLETITFENFSALLAGLFGEDGVTYERALVLFCFCSELCLRALREAGSRYFHTITNISLRFITGSLSVWVCARGGWSAVRSALQQSALGAFVLGAVVAVAVGVIVWGK